MSRAAAIRIVADQGGLVRDGVSQGTEVLVIGADGWPLRKSGSVTRNLRRASEFCDSGCDISIIGEAEFLRRIYDRDEARPTGEHTLEQLSRLLGISGLRLRRWVKLGLLRATESTTLPPTFNYQQVASAKTIARLIDRGVSPRKLANSLRRLQKYLPHDIDLHTSTIALERQLVIRDGDVLVDAGGQKRFSFEESGGEYEPKCVSNAVVLDDADTVFDRAFRCEQSGRILEAIDGYADWLKRFGDDDQVLFNLANAYLQDENILEAMAYYMRCVHLNPDHARAWNNLGLCLDRSGDRSAAIDALRRSVALDPEDPNVIYNLADMLDEVGNQPEARLLWLQIARHREKVDDEVKQYACLRLSQLDKRPLSTHDCANPLL